jgi:hypothetical protein
MYIYYLFYLHDRTNQEVWLFLKDETAEMNDISEEFWHLVNEEQLSPLEAAKQLRKKYPLKKQKLPDDWIPDGGG